MKNFQFNKGRNLKIAGAAEKEIKPSAFPKKVAIQPPDFRGLKPRLAVKVDDVVKVGTPVLTDKVMEGLKIVSPVSGKVIAINRGAKRALLEVVIETNNNQDVESFNTFGESEVRNLSRDQIIKNLVESGLWAVVRQRPFSTIANFSDKPKSVFIHAMNTEPHAIDLDVVLNGKEKEFQIGLDIVKQLTEGDVNLCFSSSAQSTALTQAARVKQYTFSGAHPTGNVSTHIQAVDPINKGDIVWYIEAQDVLRIASLFLTGVYPAERVVAITGEGLKKRHYTKTVIGASLESLLEGESLEGSRCITGSVLTGREVGAGGFLGFYDSQISVIPEVKDRELLGWLKPGLDKYTLSSTYLSAFVSRNEFSVNTDENGGHRAIVLNHLYDQYVTLDICTFFLLRSILSGDIEESEKLGILECDEEDFALCTFACPSKTDVGKIIRSGLDIIEKEG